MAADMERRRSPRYPTQHPVEGSSRDRRIEFRGTLHSLSADGCGLHLDRPVPLGTPLELRCNISGIGLAVQGHPVWSRAALGGIRHGVVLTGYASDQDHLFHRVYLGLLARRPPSPG